MNFERLKEIEAEAFECKNWQFYGKTKEELLSLAKQSFSRLTKEEAIKAENSFKAFRFSHYDPLDLVWYRFLCQTNLFFLCKCLETYSQVSNNTYEFDDKYQPDVKVFTTHEYIYPS